MNQLRGEEGQGMVEYGLILAFVAIVVIVGVTMTGTKTNLLFSGAIDKLAVVP